MQPVEFLINYFISASVSIQDRCGYFIATTLEQLDNGFQAVENSTDMTLLTFSIFLKRFTLSMTICVEEEMDM